jgi:hypothetical protein
VDKNSHPGRFLLLGIALLTLVAAMWAGLLRMRWPVPLLQTGLPLAHGPLMISVFLGILICLERAVALNRWWAYIATVLTALGTLYFVIGLPGKGGPLLIALGSAALVGDFLVILRRQPALFTWTMAAGAVAWLIGNILWLSGVPITKFVYWWAGFLVLTIAGERLELSRLSRGPSVRYFLLFLVLYIAGVTWTSVDGLGGLQAAGAGMLLLTLWLVRSDVVRRTVRLPGLPRFIAVHLLCGYFWLAMAALLGMGVQLFEKYAWQAFHYDAMLHAIFLGFVFSMIFAHAPIIFPAITGRAMAYRKLFYAHGLLLHLSLIFRIGSDLAGCFTPYRWSGVLNVLAILIFLANNAYSLGVGVKKPQIVAKALSP